MPVKPVVMDRVGRLHQTVGRVSSGATSAATSSTAGGFHSGGANALQVSKPSTSTAASGAASAAVPDRNASASSGCVAAQT